jgi:PAS domain S-box-containing protein
MDTPWSDLRLWVQQNTFAPEWFPTPLRRPVMSYLLATLLDLTATGAMLYIVSQHPQFHFDASLIAIAILLVTFGWGAVPGLYATLLGMLLIWYVVIPPHFSWTLRYPEDMLGVLLSAVLGLALCALASWNEERRRQLEAQTRILAVAQDRSVTEAQRLRAVLEAMPTPVLIAGPQGQSEELNEAARTLWGGAVLLVQRMADYAVYKAWWPESGRPVAPDEWVLPRAVRTGVAQLNDEVEIEAQDGQHKHILASAVPMRDAGGTLVGVVVNAQDITELRRLEREVAERAKELEAIFSATSDGIVLLDAQGTIVRTNRAVDQLLGLARHPELTTLSLPERMATLALRDNTGSPLPVGKWPCFRLLEGEELTGEDLLVTTPEGREVTLNVSGAALHSQTGKTLGCVEVLRDVTARRQLEQRTRATMTTLMAMGETLIQVLDTAPSRPRSEAEATLPRTSAHLMLRRLADLTRDVLGCRRVSIGALDPATGIVSPRAVVGLSTAEEQAWWATFTPPRTLEERLNPALVASLRAGHPVLLEAASLSEPMRGILIGAHTALVLPMRLGDELIGTALLDYREQPHEFPASEDMELAEAMARLGAQVLERDRLTREWTEALSRAVASEGRLRLFIDHAPAAVAMFDCEMRYLAVSQRWLQEYGIEGNILGRSHYDVFPEIPARWKEIHHRCLAGAVEAAEEDAFERLDGSIQWVKWEVRPWYSAPGEVGGLIIFAEDITARKQLELAQAESERLFRSTFEQAAVGMGRAAPDGNYLAVNQRMCDIVGYRREELLARAFQDITYPDDLPTQMEYTNQLLAGERNHFAMEKRYVRKDGTLVWTQLTVSLVRDAAGVPQYFVSVVEDIGARKWAQQELRASEEKFRTLVENIPQLVWMARPDGSIFWCNQRWYEYTGMTPASQEGWVWQSVHDPSVLPAVRQSWQHSLTSGEPFDMVFPLKDAGGMFRHFLTRVVPVRDEQDQLVGWFGTNTDIEDQLRLEREREEARAGELAAHTVARQMDQFFATAAHEIRSPVTAIAGQVDMGRRRATQLVDLLHEQSGAPATQATRLLANLEAAKASAVRLVRMTEQLFDVARARAGMLEITPMPCDLVALVREQVEAQQDAVPSRTIWLEALPDGPVTVVADADRIRQVVANFVSNALKYSSDDQPVEVRLHHTQGRVRVAVLDHGPGLSPEEQAQVWEQFHRAPGIEAQGHMGTMSGSLGLGLHICKQIVELHPGSQVGVESQLGKGSTFWFTLPLAEHAVPEPLA